MTETQTIRWGIMATGGIALAFAKDILIDPRTRNEDKIQHRLAAVASSTSESKALAFLKACNAPAGAAAYANYIDLVNDSNIDIIYIATPHSHHYQNAMLCLSAGKHVLLEKPVTVNAAQVKILAAKAREKGLLLMEAMWTRYFPIVDYARQVINSGRIGAIQRVLAEHSLPYPNEKFEETGNKHIMVNPDLAGGILLDAGIYSLTWTFLALWGPNQTSGLDSTSSRQRPKVQAAVAKYKPTGVDSMTTILLEFPRSEEDGGPAHAVATTSLGLSNDAIAATHGVNAVAPTVRIQGTKGELQVFPPTYRPTRMRLILKDGTCEEKNMEQPGPGPGSGFFNGHGSIVHPEGEGHGLFWEADDAAKAVLEGRTEGSRLGLDESILLMEIMDEVRDIAGLKYPEAIETTEYSGCV